MTTLLLFAIVAGFAVIVWRAHAGARFEDEEAAARRGSRLRHPSHVRLIPRDQEDEDADR